jgi:hypothetical protein
MDYQIPSDETVRGQRYTLTKRCSQAASVKEIRVPVPERMKRRRSSRERVAESGLSAPSPEKFAIFLAVSQTSASASPENNRQPEQDDCDRHKRRAGDVSDQDEEDRDDGEDCCDVVVHSFSIVGLPTLRCEPTPCRCVVGLRSRRVPRLESVSRETKTLRYRERASCRK